MGHASQLTSRYSTEPSGRIWSVPNVAMTQQWRSKEAVGPRDYPKDCGGPPPYRFH